MPVGHNEINFHLVFGVKIDFTLKACYVAGVHFIDPPYNVPTYASVISHELVRIIFLIADLYDIEVVPADISNAFLNAQCAEKVCFKAGPEFNSREGLWVIIVCMYGLKSAEAPFRAHLANTLRTMVFKPKFDDHNLWMRKNFLPLPQ